MKNHNDTPNKSLHQQRKYKKLSDREQMVYNELKRGKRSATQLTIILGYCDPRSYIRSLRNKGVVVLDEWIKKDDTRYKQYWIESESKAEPKGLMHISRVLNWVIPQIGKGRNE